MKPPPPQTLPQTLAQAIRFAIAAGLDKLDAQMLLLHVMARPVHDRAWLLAHDLDALDPAAQARYQALVPRRAAGEPLAYLIGHKAFYGLNLQVTADVLIPRADTETLVDWAVQVLDGLPAHRAPVKLVDLGTGSGAIALAIKHVRPGVLVFATDFSAAALAIAAANAARLALDVAFSRGAWLDAVLSHGIHHTRGGFDVIVSNPPYIADADPHLSALTHEPAQALASGPDGLDDIRQIIAQAGAHLRPGGWLLLEHGYDQAGRVRNLLRQAGFADVQSKSDLNGIERCSGARTAAAANAAN